MIHKTESFKWNSSHWFEFPKIKQFCCHRFMLAKLNRHILISYLYKYLVMNMDTKKGFSGFTCLNQSFIEMPQQKHGLVWDGFTECFKLFFFHLCSSDRMVHKSIKSTSQKSCKHNTHWIGSGKNLFIFSSWKTHLLDSQKNPSCWPTCIISDYN